ncbi:MAG: 23S rRNA (uracil(1939)-C(5))-methyltransferase RlmD [Candidatus Sumerlaeaceae bacterium]
MTIEIKKGSIVEAEVDAVAFGGKGIARVGGMVLFIEGGLPGDKLRARVTRRKPQYGEAELVELMEPSPARRQWPCPVFGACGGCKWQHYEYAQQIIAKQQHVADSLKHIGKQHAYEMRPILASPNEWFYRNKMEFSFGHDDDDNRIIIGFHRAGDFRRIVRAGEACQIQPPGMNEPMAWMEQRLNEEAAREGDHFCNYNQSRHIGFLRHLVVRHSYTTGHFLIAILTASGAWAGAEQFATDFMHHFPMCRGFQWGTTDALSDVARMEKQRLQRGEDSIEERLGDKVFRVSTFSFFQTNTPGAKILYDVVREFAELTGRETVLDAYCGTGTIGIYVSDRAANVVGIELVKEAVWDARYNAKQNGAANCTFLAGEMRDVLPTLPSTLGTRFDRVIVDPPRGGMDKKSLRLLIEIGAPVLVYVSCNPSTLARDSVTLAESGYVAEVVQPVDMFPHTYHVESVIRFRKREPQATAVATN